MISKNIRNIFIILGLAGLFFTSCDKVDAPYAIAKPQSHDTTDTSTVVRKILLEDYTGHTCPNCPEGTLIGEALELSYGGKVIMMAVHAGYFAKPLAAPFTSDYRTVAGEAWNNNFGFSSYPNGLVNRKELNSNLIIAPDQWGTAIEALINTPPDAGIKISCSFDTTQRLLTADIQSKFINSLSGNYNVTVCILEDGIVDAQKNSVPEVGPTPIIYDYEYKNMVRAALTDPWGELVATDPAAASDYHNHYSYIVADNIVIGNSYLVAFITNADTKEVIQAEKKKIIK